jgi:hypothetical protein
VKVDRAQLPLAPNHFTHCDENNLTAATGCQPHPGGHRLPICHGRIADPRARGDEFLTRCQSQPRGRRGDEGTASSPLATDSAIMGGRDGGRFDGGPVQIVRTLAHREHSGADEKSAAPSICVPKRPPW